MTTRPAANAPPEAPSPRSHVGISQAARAIGCGLTFVRNLVDRGGVEGFRQANGHRRVYQNSLDTWIMNDAAKYRLAQRVPSEPGASNAPAHNDKPTERPVSSQETEEARAACLSADAVEAVAHRISQSLRTAAERRLAEENVSLREAGLQIALAFAAMQEAWSANDEAQRHRRRAIRQLRKAAEHHQNAIAQFFLPGSPPS